MAHRRRADFFFSSSPAVALIDLPASSSTRSTAAAELAGLLRQHPFAAALRLGCLLRSRPDLAAAPMALIVLRKSPALTRLLTLYAREAEPAGRGDGPPPPRRFLFHLFAGGGADRRS